MKNAKIFGTEKGSNGERDDGGLKETRYLSSIPGMIELIREGLSTPLDECVPESELPNACAPAANAEKD